MKFYLHRWVPIVISFTLLSASISANAFPKSPVQKKLAELEAASGGQIGVCAIDTGRNLRIQYRADQRFPMGCTSKVIGVAAVLKQSMTDGSFLKKRIFYSKNDLTSWTPITKKHLTDGMTIEQLCMAAISYSDNTAMNLLVKQLGGLNKINQFARSIGNKSFRQDHGWPDEAAFGGIGNLYDSSTPAAMENSLQNLTLGNILASPQRKLLVTWLKNNTTGDNRIRASVPKGWAVADKTGSGSFYGTTNDIGIIWPPQSSPILIAIYYTNNKKDAVKREDIVATVTRIVLHEFHIHNGK